MYLRGARVSFVASLALATVICSALVASAYEMAMVEQRLTRDMAYQFNPSISGTQVVYYDQRSGSNDIYLHDLATGSERRLTTDAGHQSRPAISGTKVVYEDERHGNKEIYLYDLATGVERRLTNNSAAQQYPYISGTKLVYEDGRHGNKEIYLYDLATGAERRLTGNSATQNYPRISGTRVVYEDNRHGNPEIYLYDLASGAEQRLTNDSDSQTVPVISGTRVVYKDEGELRLYDLVSGTDYLLSKSTSVSGDRQVALEGTRVVYSAYRYGQTDIFLGELITPRVSTSAPSVVSYGGKAVVKGAALSPTAVPVAGRTAYLESSSDGVNWTRMGSPVTTSSSGAFSFSSGALYSARRLRVVLRGDIAYPTAESASVLIKPKVYLTRPSLGATTLTYGKTYKATGYLKPKHTAGTYPVKIAAYRYSNGKYRYVKTYSAKAFDYSSYTKYVKSIKLPTKGKWRLRAVHPEDALNAKTYSSWRYVTVK